MAFPIVPVLGALLLAALASGGDDDTGKGGSGKGGGKGKGSDKPAQGAPGGPPPDWAVQLGLQAIFGQGPFSPENIPGYEGGGGLPFMGSGGGFGSGGGSGDGLTKDGKPEESIGGFGGFLEGML